MSLGKKFWVFGEADIIAGMSTSDDLADAGYSPSTDAVNPIVAPGILYAPAYPTDKSTNVVGEIIASSEDPQFSGEQRVYVDDEGNYYSASSAGTMTLDRTDTTNPSGYVQGKTDMNAFDGSVFATTTTTVVKWTVDSVFTDNFIDLTSTFSNASLVPHPLLSYEGKQYIGNGNLLLRMDDASDSTPTTILTLSTFQTIISLGVDPGSGRMLISTTQGLNISDTRANTNKVLYYDGFSNKALKVVPVDNMVTAFPFTEGQLYCAYGQNLGYWNGAGITFLRKINVLLNNERLLYKHHFTSIDATLYFIEGTKIIAHGPIRQGGEKVFYPAFKNQVNSNVFTNIAYLGSSDGTTQLLTMAFATDKFYTFDINSVATTNTQRFFSNENTLSEYNDGVWLRRVRIFWKNQVSNNVDPGSIRFLNEDGMITSIGQSGLFDLQNTSGASQAMKEIYIGGGSGLRIYQLQFELILDTVNPGIRRIEFFGDPANI